MKTQVGGTQDRVSWRSFELSLWSFVASFVVDVHTCHGALRRRYIWPHVSFPMMSPTSMCLPRSGEDEVRSAVSSGVLARTSQDGLRDVKRVLEARTFVCQSCCFISTQEEGEEQDELLDVAMNGGGGLALRIEGALALCR